jgi:hypothetical protein
MTITKAQEQEKQNNLFTFFKLKKEKYIGRGFEKRQAEIAATFATEAEEKDFNKAIDVYSKDGLYEPFKMAMDGLRMSIEALQVDDEYAY